MNPTLSIIIPAYNEEKRIEKTLNYISKFLHVEKITFEIIVVVNNSTDNSLDLLNKIKIESISELVVINIPKSGIAGNMKGYAIGVGMRKASGLYHIFIDADNATRFDSVTSFINYINEGYGVVIGSRYVKGSHIVKKQPLFRIILSRIGNLIIRLLLLPSIYDTQCGFKMFSKKASSLIFSKMTINGWGADLEMLAIAKIFDFKIKESPIYWEAQDESTVKGHAFLYTLQELFKIRKNIKEKIYEKEIKAID